MPKHRSSVYTVVREKWQEIVPKVEGEYIFDGIVGTYLTPQRADEIAAASTQQFLDAGMVDDEYHFSVSVSTYYDE